MSEVISPEEYRARILAEIDVAAARRISLPDALGLVVVGDVHAEVSLPGFDNSAMDGYAVRREEVAGATEDGAVTLPVAGEIGAGQVGLEDLPAGSVAKIMTGAPMPSGADAVVPYEWTDRGADRVRIDRAPTEAQHVRRAGEDVTAGEVVLREGTVLGPRQIGLLASAGHRDVRVRPRPRVTVLSTGSELREPGAGLGPGQIHDGNSYLLAAAASAAGAEVHRVGIVPDAVDQFLHTVDDQLTDSDLIVTSGGVSAGDYDVVKAALRERGVWFGPVAMQPGKPQGFGMLPADPSAHPEATVLRRVPIFCLPGNPVSSYVSFEMFVLPALRRLMGRSPQARPMRPATLTHAVTSPPGRWQFLRGHYDGVRGSVSAVGGPGSHLVGDLAAADCLIVIEADTVDLAEGAEVDVLVLEEEF